MRYFRDAYIRRRMTLGRSRVHPLRSGTWPQPDTRPSSRLPTTVTTALSLQFSPPFELAILEATQLPKGPRIPILSSIVHAAVLEAMILRRLN